MMHGQQNITFVNIDLILLKKILFHTDPLNVNGVNGTELDL
jgi:hypothetical protein